MKQERPRRSAKLVALSVHGPQIVESLAYHLMVLNQLSGLLGADWYKGR